MEQEPAGHLRPPGSERVARRVAYAATPPNTRGHSLPPSSRRRPATMRAPLSCALAHPHAARRGLAFHPTPARRSPSGAQTTRTLACAR